MATSIKQIMGVYYILNRKTNQFYVGSAKDCYGRWATHRYNLKNGKHNNKHFQSAWDNTEDKDDWFFIYKEFPTRDLAYEEEQSVLDKNKDNPLMLNRTLNARSPIHGIEQTEEMNKSRANKLRSIWSDDEARKDRTKGIRESWKDPERRKARSGGGNPFARRLTVNGVIYGSAMDASRATGISNKRLGADAKDPDKTYVYYTDGNKPHFNQVAKENIRSIKKIMIDGIIYPTMKMAMKDTSIAWKTLVKRAKDPLITNITMNPDEMLGGRLLTDDELERLK